MRRGRFARWVLVLAVIVGLVGFYGVIPAWRAWEATSVPAWQRRSPPAAPAGYRDVSFPTSGGLTLRGWYRPSRNGAAVVLTHGYGLDREYLMPQADALAAAGFGVLTYDLRGHGASDGVRVSRGWREADDVLAAVEFVRSQPDVKAGRIGAFGFSIGAQATLRAAGRSEAIRAAVADGAVAGSFADEPRPVGLNEWLNYPAMAVYYAIFPFFAEMAAPPPLTTAIAHIAPRPLLLIAAGTGHEQRQERKLLAAAGDPKALYEVPETYHGGGIRARPEEYRQRLVGFFTEHLAP